MVVKFKGERMGHLTHSAITILFTWKKLKVDLYFKTYKKNNTAQSQIENKTKQVLKENLRRYMYDPGEREFLKIVAIKK